MAVDIDVIDVNGTPEETSTQDAPLESSYIKLAT